MTWVKLDDGLFLNPKIGHASLEALGVYTLSLTYAAHNLTDGRVPVTALHLLRCSETISTELVQIGLWEAEGNTSKDGFRVHDYLQYNPSRRKVLRERQKTKDRVTRHRTAVKRQRNAVTNAPVTAPPVPVPHKKKESSNEDSVRTIFEHWKVTFSLNGATRLTDGRRTKIKARLKHYSPDDLMVAIDGCRASDFHVREGHTDLASIFHNDERVEQHMARAKGKGHFQANRQQWRDKFGGAAA